MPVPEEVKNLVKRFDNNVEDYRKGQLKEAEVRNEFIDPLFKALGWDVDNNKGLAGPYKEVSLEYSGKLGVEGTPDYRFALGGTSRFFVEAKKPSVNLKDGREPALQVRRYAWSAQLPLSILTDFEEFVIYDCRIKPDQNDKPDTARDLYLTYDKYAEEKYWDKIYSLFSKEAVQEGSLEEYAKALKTKRGKEPFDKTFLSEIESWREMLARNLALCNDLSRRELNFAVQKTIDRILFLRICEDRGIEKYGRLKEIQEDSGIYRNLCDLFREADQRYDSGLFHFREEKGHSTSPDKLTLALNLDDEPLAHILKRLYYPDSPYEFSVVPVEILGQIYERFLGKEILLTSDHHAVIEEKPEVKKAGGVYYTPSYIVDYIVENTVGKLLEGKNPKQVEEIKIVDPACGSGSFLLGAFQHLIDWHRDYYVNHGGTAYKNRLFQSAEGEWRLRADWQEQFHQVFDNDTPGFDAVIGNPPYLNIDDAWGKGDVRQKYIKNSYSQVYNDKTDILFYFLAKAGQIGKDKIAFIVSRAFLEAYKANKLRGWLAEHADITEIVDFRNYYVFEGVGITTAIVTLDKVRHENNADIFQLHGSDFLPGDLTAPRTGSVFQHFSAQQEDFGSESWAFAGSEEKKLIEKIDASGETLGNVLLVGKGMETGRNNVFGKLTRAQIDEWDVPREWYFMRARNSDIGRYTISNSEQYLLYLEDVRAFSDLPEGVKAHLRAHEDELKARAAYQRGDCEWWRYTWPLHKGYLGRAKLYCPYLATHNRFALDEQRSYLGLTDTTALYDADQPEKLRYLMGLLNSKLLTFRFTYIGKLKSDGILEYFWNSISKLPIRRINFSDSADVERHNRMVRFVERMSELCENLKESRTEWDRTRIQSDISVTDEQIQHLVYELYGLTGEEVELVEVHTS